MIIKFKYLFICFVFLLAGGITKTYWDIQPVDDLFLQVNRERESCRLTDRFGHPLTMNYQTRWNHQDQIPLHYFPDFMVKALILSEDQNFYAHSGIDWSAKGAALWQNIKARRIVRGASTLTEQVVHLLTSRPRTVWSKWLELIEAQILEYHFNKNDILEFYLNQVPFAGNRQGLVQAARYYFNRDLSTLTPKEILALIILIKAPSSYDLRKSTKRIQDRLEALASRLVRANYLSQEALDSFLSHPLTLEQSHLSIQASHFVSYLKQSHQTDLHRLQQTTQKSTVQTTLDGSLQTHVQKLLDQRIQALSSRHMSHGAVLVINHQTGEVLSWNVASESKDTQNSRGGKHINAVMALRQPGSALKPFVYALALEKGWRATTLIDDKPLVGAVGTGLHKFRNYSNTYYGPVTLREALANSLNVPAVKTLQFVGVESCLATLKLLGFSSLQREADVYDEGLALGNGEVTLRDLVQAYTVFPNGGKLKPLRYFREKLEDRSPSELIFTSATASIIGDILSDSLARRLEFGLSSVMNLPVQTAIKTGTSTDYRDAWVVGYNHRHIVGIWMGNLDNTPMNGVTGATGPVLLLRSVFSHLTQHDEVEGLPTDPFLIKRDVCVKRSPRSDCTWQIEWMQPGEDSIVEVVQGEECRLLKPTPGLRMALDPRVPPDKQKFEFQVTSLMTPDGLGECVEWILDGKSIAQTTTPKYLWTLEKGKHFLRVIIYQGSEGEKRELYQSPEVGFLVK